MSTESAEGATGVTVPVQTPVPVQVQVPVQTIYRPSTPVSLRRTLRSLLRGTGDPTMRFDGDAIWRTATTPAGSVTLHLVQRDGAIHATAWGDGAETAIAGVPELCGHGDDWSELDVSRSALLTEVLRASVGLRLTRTNAVLEAMVPAILEQKVTGLEARRAWRILVTKYGDLPPGPAPAGMRVIPTAEVWRRIPSWEWHRAGVGPQRSDAVMRVSKVAASLERTLALGRGGVIVASKLRSIPGVGEWTAAETTQRSHGDPDSPSFGDYHLPSQVGLALIGTVVDDDGMRELLEPYAGHRQRVMRLIEASGVQAPRRGARITIQDHRRH